MTVSWFIGTVCVVVFFLFAFGIARPFLVWLGKKLDNDDELEPEPGWFCLKCGSDVDLDTGCLSCGPDAQIVQKP